MGRRRRRHGLAEGVDVGTWAGDDRGVAARVAAMETARMPRFYLDLRAHRRRGEWADPVHARDRGRLPGRRGAAADAGRGQGQRLRPPRGLAAASRAGLAALGFELLADERHASKTVTAALVPEGLDWKAFNTDLKQRGLVLAGGQGKLTGKIFRLGHLGSVTLDEILGAMSTLEIVSIGHGRQVEPGSAVAVAQRAAWKPWASPRRGSGRPCEGPGRRGGRPEGLEQLRKHHEVDERIGLTREELCSILPEYDALIVRSQVQVDAELIAAGRASS